jgi:hypothetical protein
VRTARAAALVLPVVSLCLVPVLLAVVLLGCGAEPHAAGVDIGAPRPAELVLAGDGELWVVDVATGRTRHRVVSKLAPGDPMHRIVRRGDRFVLWGFATYTMRDGDAPLETLAADTWFFIPSATADRVWLAVLEPGQPATSVRLAAVREVTVDGRVTVPDARPPGGEWPLSAVRSGIVYDDDGEHVVWDPVARAEVRRVRGGLVGPGHDDLLVTAHPDDCGDLLLTDVTTGAERRIPPIAPRGCWAISEAAFSPDGSRLAIPFTRRGGFQVRHELALIDVSRATASPVAGTEVPAGYVFVDWSTAGDQVFITGGERFKQRTIVAYRLGDPAARSLRVEVGDFYDMAAR